MRNGLWRLADSVYWVPSKSTAGKMHLVDMILGRCTCFVGKDGSPCSHQFFLWSDICSTVLNFCPVFNPADRQFFSILACGEALPLSYYEPIHGGPASSDARNQSRMRMMEPKPALVSISMVSR